MNTFLKMWATPAAIGAFFISSVTGLLIFFDIEIGAVEPVHRWLSWLLLGGVALHAVSNRKALAGYFSRRPAMALFGLVLAVTGAAMLPVFGEGEEGGKRSGKAAVRALESAPLSAVALVVKASPDELAARLAARGIQVSDTSRSISEIAGSNGKEGMAVLAAVLGVSGEEGEEH